MARVTVEDCIKQDFIDDRYELVILAGKRAKDIGAGSPALVENNQEKNAVIALREIAAGKIDIPELKEIIINSMMHSSAINNNDDLVVFDDEDEMREDVIQEISSNYQTPESELESDFELDDDSYIGEDILEQSDSEED
jgi:DNA-directed RNA polymerase subunit omega